MKKKPRKGDYRVKRVNNSTAYLRGDKILVPSTGRKELNSLKDERIKRLLGIQNE